MTHTSPTDAPPLGTLDRLAAFLCPPVRTLGGRGTLLTPLILVLGVSLLAAGAMRLWASAAPPGSGGEALIQASPLVWVVALAAPLAAALKGLVFAAMAWGMLVLLGGVPTVRSLVSALFYGEAILALQALWVTAGAFALSRPAPGLGGAMPLASGLDAWVGSDGGWLLAVAQHVTPFHLAWVVFLTLAFTAQPGVSRGRGAVTALLLWGLSTGLAVLRIPMP